MGVHSDEDRLNFSERRRGQLPQLQV